MSVVWLPEARDDIKRLYESMHDVDANAALRGLHAIRLAAARLREQPRLGRRLDDDSGRRELVVAVGAGACILRSRVHNDTTVVLRVRHEREWGDRG